jgi:hypothetical protein
MRLSSLIAALLVAAPIGLHAGTASAQFFQGQSVLGGRLHGPQGPWCVRANNNGAEENDCSFGSFAACNREARRSNGFCTQNFSGYVEPVRRKKANRERRY